MSNLAHNIRAIEIAVDSSRRVAIDGRNNVLRKYHAGINESVKDSIIYTQASRVYPRKTLEQFLTLIDNKPISQKIRFLGGDDNQALAMVANDLANMVYSRALQFRDSGKHIDSLRMYIKEVGGPALIKIERGGIRESMLPDRAIVSIVPVIEYANALEVNAVGGVLYHAARQFRAIYRNRFAIKYNYVAGNRIGEPGGSFPRIQIAHYGNLTPRMSSPGKKARRSKRTYAQVKGRQA